MEQAKALRGLRIAWSAVFGTLCVLLIVLWVRSYDNPSNWPSPAVEARNLAFYSTPGLVIAAEAPFVEYVPSGNEVHSYYIPARFQHIGSGLWIGAPRKGFWGFNFGYWSRSNWVVQAPYWFPIAISAAFATLSWVHWSRQFTLRTLLIATALIAVVLGLAVWMNR